MAFIAFFARRHLFAHLFTLFILLLGMVTLKTIPLAEYPNVNTGETEVLTFYPGASAEDVELNVTNRLEEELSLVNGIKRYTSVSELGRSNIEITIKENAVLETVNRDIRQAINRVTDLPAVVTQAPLVTEVTSASFGFFTLGISSTGSYGELRRYARQIERKLKAIDGVGSIDAMSLNAREFHIEVDPSQIKRHQVSLTDITSAISQRNITATGGSLESYQDELSVVTLAQMHSLEDLGQLIVKVSDSGTHIKLSDVARLVDDYEPAKQHTRLNGKDVIAFSIGKSETADAATTATQIKALIEKERARTQGQFELATAFDLSEDLNNKLSIVSSNGAIGLVLVIVALSLFINRYIAFWVAVSIPVCLLGVVALLPISGEALDSLTMAALLLTIGIVVDDSVLIAESIYRRAELGDSPLEACVNGVAAVFKPIIAALTVSALVFSTMFFIPGMVGKFIYVIPLTVVLTLLLSLVECFLILPSHLSSGLSRVNAAERKHWFNRVKSGFKPLLAFALRWRYGVVTVFFTYLLGIGVWVAPQLGFDFFPKQAARYIEIETKVSEGSSLAASKAMNQAMEQLLLGLPDSERGAYIAKIGSPYSSFNLTLTPFSQRSRTAEQIVSSLREQAQALAEFKSVRFMIDAGGPPGGDPLEVRLIGGDGGSRQELGDDIQRWLAEQEGVYDLNRNDVKGKPQLELRLDYPWLAKYGLTADDIAQTLRVAFEGDLVSSARVEDENVDFRVLFADEYRTLDHLKDLELVTSGGDRVKLWQLVHWQESKAEAERFHFDGERTLILTAQLDNSVADPNLLSLAIQDKFAGRTGNVRLEIGGESEETDQAVGGLVYALLLSLVGVYMVLVLLFSSLFQPLLALVAVPFSLAAVAISLWLHGQPLSFFSLIGGIGLVGVVTNTALVLISHLNELKKQNVDNWLLVGTTDRLRPILCTTITTVAGLLPLAYGLGGTDVYMGPMALALAYGLIFCVPVILFLVPCLYRVGEDIKGLLVRPSVALKRTDVSQRESQLVEDECVIDPIKYREKG